jgi:metal-responsive CopG/Arc/MetJ family transcriptional regulator
MSESKEMKVLSVRVPRELLKMFREKVKREYLRVPDVIRSLIAGYVRDEREKGSG